MWFTKTSRGPTSRALISLGSLLFRRMSQPKCSFDMVWLPGTLSIQGLVESGFVSLGGILISESSNKFLEYNGSENCFIYGTRRHSCLCRKFQVRSVCFFISCRTSHLFQCVVFPASSPVFTMISHGWPMVTLYNDSN